MAEIEDMGLDEFYENFICIAGATGEVLFVYNGDKPTTQELALAAEIGAVLDRQEKPDG